MIRNLRGPALILVPILCVFPASLTAQKVDIAPIQKLIQEGKTGEAVTFLDTLLALLPTHSDLLYLKGVALPHDLASLETALRSNSWERFHPFDAQTLLAERYLRRKLFREALTLLEGMNQRDKTRPEYFFLLIQAHKGLENQNQALNLLRNSLALFPDDPRFLFLYFRYKGSVSPNDAALWDLVNPKKPYYLEALAEYLRLLPPGDQKNALVAQYLRAGGKDPKVYLPVGGEKDEDMESRWTSFTQMGGLTNLNYWEELYRKFPQGKMREKLDAELKRFTGWMYRDRENDGYVEERRNFAVGALLQVELDVDQDGQWDIQIDFLNQNPHVIRLRRPDKERVHVYFLQYPQVERIQVLREDQYVEYRYRDLVWKKGIMPDSAGPIPISLAELQTQSVEQFLTFELSLAKPFQRIETCVSCKKTRRYTLQEGALLSFQEEQEIQPGLYRKRTVSFRNGIPLVGYVDVDGDGTYDIRETYQQGTLDSIELLSGGRTVYRESLSKTFKEWDFNGDGKVDAREYTMGKSKKEQGFSSPGEVQLLDFLFDVSWVQKP